MHARGLLKKGWRMSSGQQASGDDITCFVIPLHCYSNNNMTLDQYELPIDSADNAGAFSETPSNKRAKVENSNSVGEPDNAGSGILMDVAADEPSLHENVTKEETHISGKLEGLRSENDQTSIENHCDS